MLNRAKCKLCNKIIELKEIDGLESCECGEIAFEYRNKGHIAICKRLENLVAIDDEGNEILVETIDETNVEISQIAIPEKNKKEMLKVLDGWIENIEKLPPEAMSTYISHYDLLSALMILSSVFKAKD